MKKGILFLTFFTLILRGVTTAQNPYESIGKKAKVMTLSNGKYQEIFTNDTIVPIGSVMYNRVTGDIVAFLTRDTMYAEYNLEPEVVSRWLSPDPLGAKYTQWSPYNYALNNPIRFIDPDGQEVKPANEQALNIIKYGLTKEESAYVQLNSSGMIDRASMEQGMKNLGTVGGNFQALLGVVQAKEITEIIVSESFEYIDHNGSKQKKDFGGVTYDSDMSAMWDIQKGDYEKSGLTKADFEKNNTGLSKEESTSGFLGVTLYGENKDGGGYGKSTNGNTTVILNSNARDKTQTIYQAHENYGHNYFKTLGKPSSHGAVKSRTSDAPNNNKALENQIYDREREAEKNYQQHKN